MDKQQPWHPYSKDCSLGYCSYYCPQWCFFLFPPPPPPSPSHPVLSPLLIAVIAVVSTAFLLVAYYLILTHYRRHSRSPAPPPENQLAGLWYGSRPDGLDETLINKISACQYRTGGGLIVDGTDCSVCLSQFEDGDRIRLLPKCNHPFHVHCIDMWLKSHSSCPLCRAGILPLPVNRNHDTLIRPVIREGESEPEPEPEQEPEPELESDTAVENVAEGTMHASHDIIEIGEGRPGVIGRSLSMDSSLRREAGANADPGMGSSRWTRALHYVISPVRMKRSRSSRSTLPT